MQTMLFRSVKAVNPKMNGTLGDPHARTIFNFAGFIASHFVAG